MVVPTLAHVGQAGAHDLVLLAGMIVAPVVLLGIVILFGRRRDDDELEDDEA